MPLAPGDTVAQYRIDRLLARGGSADVYAATHVSHGHRVALKVLSRLRGLDRDRAIREITIAGKLDHPRLVRLVEHGATADDGIFLAMELLHGETLSARLKEGPMPGDLAVETLRQVADAVAWAHDRGIVHRDLKPANVFLVGRREASIDVRVLDFGLAMVRDEQSLTRTGDLLGTPAYMAPERLRGSRERDPRADVYALGVTLYECLADALPYGAESPLGMMFQAAFSAPIPLERRVRGLPEDLLDLVRACLSKDPDGRPPSARVFLDRLDALGPVRPSALEVASRPEDDAREQRLVMAVLTRAPRDASLLGQLVEDAGAEDFPLPQGSLAVFGRECWSETIPRDALGLARAAALTSSAVSIVSAKVLRGDDVSNALVDAAVAALPSRGIGVDASAASLLRGHCVFATSEDGRRSVPILERAGDVTRHATPFVGRSRDVEWLLSATERAASCPKVTAAVFSGPPGIGLSRLMDEALRAAKARWTGLHALRVRCEMPASDAPLSGLRALLGEHLHPKVASALQTPSRSGDPQAALDRARAHIEGIFTALASDAPVLLALDDAQWLDPTSRAVLRSVFDGAPSLPLSLWLFVREGAHDVAARVHAAAVHRELTRLDAHASEEIILSLGVTDRVRIQTITERTDGIPAAIVALALAPPDEALPLDVEAAVRAQIDRLTPFARDVVKRASVFGRVFWRDGVEALGAIDATDELVRLGWVSERPYSRLPCGGEFEFRSALVADTARELFAPDSRRALHGLAAAWLERFDEALPEELAGHWDAAGERGRAAALWVKTTEMRGACGVAESACRAASEALRHELDDSARWRVLRARDNALQLSGDRALQREGLDAMRDLARRLGPDEAAEIAWRFVHHARMIGDAPLARSAAQTFVTSGDAPNPRWSAVGLCELALLEADVGNLDVARDHATDALTRSARVDDVWVAARAAHARAYVDVERGDDLSAALARYAEAGDLYHRAGDLRREAITLVNRAATLALLGRFGEGIDLLDLAIECARAVGNQRSVAVCFENRGSILRALGDFDAAEDDLASALSRAEEIGHVRLAEAARVERLYLAVASGASEDVVAARLNEVRALAESEPPSPILASILASALHGLARLGVRDDATVLRALAMVDAERNPSHVAELAAALWIAGGRVDADLARYRDALDRCLTGASDALDRSVRRRGFERRWLAQATEPCGD